MVQDEYGARSTGVPPRKQLKRCRKKRRNKFESATLPRPEPWDENTTSMADDLYLDATTFAIEPLFKITSAKQEQITDSDKYVVSPNGAFAYQNRILHVGTPLALHGHGHVIFSDDVTIPILVDLTRDTEGNEFPETVSEAERVYCGNVWMSLTPNEMMSQRSGIEAGKGTVVVERSQELLEWYGYDLCAEYPKITNVICDDIYTQIGRHADDAVYLLDIWPTQEGADSDRRFQRFKMELGDRLWGWGGVSGC